jgi:hypothetical protein
MSKYNKLSTAEDSVTVFGVGVGVRLHDGSPRTAIRGETTNRSEAH